jgi:hypothetical protein
MGEEEAESRLGGFLAVEARKRAATEDP